VEIAVTAVSVLGFYSQEELMPIYVWLSELKLRAEMDRSQIAMTLRVCAICLQRPVVDR
jgi:hypothetical protein